MTHNKIFEYPSGFPLTLQDLIINAVDVHADRRMLILVKENYTRPLNNILFCPISTEDVNDNPQNTECIPPVIIYIFLALKQNRTLFKGLYTFNYADIKEIIGKIAAKLNHEGIGKGDFICSYSALNTESSLLFWASMLQGVIFVPLDFNWPLFLLKTTLHRLKPKLLFCDRDRYGLVSKMNRYQCIV